jgi:hypothetical protein
MYIGFGVYLFDATNSNISVIFHGGLFIDGKNQGTKRIPLACLL